MGNKNNEYDFVCDIEAALLNRRFLPYAVGTSSRKLTSDNGHMRANFVFSATVI